MTPNRQGPAYALFVRSWLPCGAANSASASSALTMEYPAHGIGLSRLRIKIRRQYKHCTGGGGPQILSAFVKQRTYRPCPHVIPRIPGFQDVQETFLEGSAKFGLRRLRNYHANHAIFRRVMIHLMAHKAHNGTYSPAGLAYRRLQNNHHPPEDTAIFPRRGILSDLGAFLGGTTCST